MINNEFISIKTGYPEDYAELILTDKEKKGLQYKNLSKTKEVEILFQDGHTEIGRRYQCKGDDYCFWLNSQSFVDGNPLKITHWRKHII